ncbi:MAG: 16S rRNA (uracil(1498)-N(3))-methyltransferase [Bacteroidota bacterium]
MHLFYTPDISGDVYTLGKEDSRHCIKVLRLEVGDGITLTDGRGCFYDAEIVEPNPKAAGVKIIRKTDEKPLPYNVHVAVAPTKNISRTEWAVEKCTELGISRISLLNCEHSERKTVKEPRLERIITAAMKQSLKAYRPALKPMVAFRSFIELPFRGQKFIAYLDEKYDKHLVQQAEAGDDALILVGPEGDFSREEVSLAIEKGFVPVSLGASRLRTETAMVAACHTIHLVNQIKQA